MKFTDPNSSWSQSMLNGSASQVAKKHEVIKEANSRQLFQKNQPLLLGGTQDNDGTGASNLLSGSDMTGLAMVTAMDNVTVGNGPAVDQHQ